MSTVRMSGLISGLDTDTLIKGMLDAQRLKNKKVTDKQTKLTWEQDKWKELNAKLYKLYTEDLSKMRLQSNYLTKKATSSDETLVSVTGGPNAPVGAHTLIVDTLASSQYVTGGQLDKTVTESTKLKSAIIGIAGSAGNDSVITITNGEKEKNLIVTDSTTLGDFINACKGIGLNASYDETQQRLFVSSRSSGKDNLFTITTGEISSEGSAALSNINSLVNYAGIDSTGQTKVSAAIKTLEGKTIAPELYSSVMNANPDTPVVSADPVEQKVIDALTTLRDYAIQKAETDAKTAAVQQTKDEIKTAILDNSGNPDGAALTALEAQIQSEKDAGTLPIDTNVTIAATERYKQNQAVLKELRAQVDAKVEQGKLTIPEGKTREVFVNETAKIAFDNTIQADRIIIFNRIIENEYASPAPSLDTNGIPITDADGKVISKATQYQNRVNEIYNGSIATYKTKALTDPTNGLVTQLETYLENATITPSAGTSNLIKIGLDEITGAKVDTTTKDKLTVVAATDAKIILDGAELSGDSNTIIANGLTITAKGVTPAGTKVSINVSSNTQANYDMVKNFIKSYNDILKEMNTLYYADSSRGYDPLSDDEKESMSDDQIEKWESKIKGSILRRDTGLGSLIDAMKGSMNTVVKVDDKKYSLASFGIETSSDYSEKGLLHLFGNKDDPAYSAKEDKLMKALEEDPDIVMEALSGISMDLYDTMADKMSSIPNVRSALTFYNDKTMVTQQREYTKKVSILEEKLTDMENKYYKQFAAMETAMAKMQSQSNALAGMLGTSTQ